MSPLQQKYAYIFLLWSKALFYICKIKSSICTDKYI